MDDIKQWSKYLLSLPGSDLSYPFGPDTLVFKVKGKMFALIGHRNDKDFMNLKAIPDNVLFLTEQYESITPGYHMNKKHWVSVEIGHSENDGMLKGLADDSYLLVKSSLTKKLQNEVDGL
ncbi:MmcQ/YjbR family DNA-binding protein [Vibrio algarum]|uniref:MmcQ/YjbR family DNA-binding protein n=1 Tax=Vibrio algarum TaxID=3020714 RepID=A0ABT4YQM3_9VIBR|nr:MmcQ/YjbR family DNA-binding protein [Vibrio sp. KJ40-1]MDB1123856.1 MmcQ/YjbR family DNA-binding protein [Vibrio sp. KJ40-1]